MDEHQKIAEGDIVDHKLFGLGKVQAVDNRGYINGTEVTGNGYPVTVSWDDPDRREFTVMSYALKKVSSPDVRPFIFWEKQWQPLRENWLKARREVELLCMTFEPVPESRRLDEAIEVEAAAWVRMKEFIDAPRT